MNTSMKKISLREGFEPTFTGKKWVSQGKKLMIKKVDSLYCFNLFHITTNFLLSTKNAIHWSSIKPTIPP